jgi:CIC family chloride channel protein
LENSAQDLDLSESIDNVMDTFSKTDACNLPVPDKGFYVGFLSKSRIYTTYRELLIQVSEE